MLQYYTDGSCEPNPGTGGFAVVENKKPVALGGDFNTTNIRMEGRALIEALKLANGQPCQIYSDSEFWIKVITIWSIPWEKNGWTKKKGPIVNLDLVKELVNLYRGSKAELIWVRGHADDEGNIAADYWANEARKQQLAKQ